MSASTPARKAPTTFPCRSPSTLSFSRRSPPPSPARKPLMELQNEPHDPHRIHHRATASIAAADTARTNMPSDYDVLNSKSIFNKDRRGWQGRQRDSFNNNNDTPRRLSSPAAIAPPSSAPSWSVTTVISPSEQPGNGSFQNLRKGDSLPNDAGTIEEVTLDFL